MVPKKKDKAEILWQGFEKTGSVEAYMAYFRTKLKKEKVRKDDKSEAKRNSGR